MQQCTAIISNASQISNMLWYSYNLTVWQKVKVKWSCYRHCVAQRVGTGTALLFHGRGTRRGWVVSSSPWPHFTPGKDPVPILLEAGWAPGPVWTGGKSHPHQDSIPDSPARIQSLHQLSYPAHTWQYGTSEYITDIKQITYTTITHLTSKKWILYLFLTMNFGIQLHFMVHPIII